MERVALAQTLIMDPPIILMDEPFSGLDLQTRLLMENELLALWQADWKWVPFITHDLEEAISLSDRVLILSAGPGTTTVVGAASCEPCPLASVRTLLLSASMPISLADMPSRAADLSGRPHAVVIGSGLGRRRRCGRAGIG